MGNFTNLTILWLVISLISGMVVLAQVSVDPTSPYLFGNYALSTSNLITSNIAGMSFSDTQGWKFNKYQNFTTPTQQTTGTLSSGFQFPDWLNSGFVWLHGVASFFLNILGAPYTLVSQMNLIPAYSAMLGAFWSILSLLIITNWVLGRDT